MNEAMMERDARDGNRRVAIRALALELVKNDSFLTMAEAVQRATELYGRGVRA